MPHYTQLSSDERTRIYALFQLGKSKSQVAYALGRHRSTITREVFRNRLTPNHLYIPKTAHAMSKRRRAHRPLNCKFNWSVRLWIEQKLKLQWSPEQISGRLFEDLGIKVSHEWIYQFVIKDRKSGGKLYLHLRRSHRKYRKRCPLLRVRTKFDDAKSIEIRPKAVDKRARIGDWEGDTIIGAQQKSAIVSLVERVTLLTKLKKTQTRLAHETRNAIVEMMAKTNGPKLTLTLDRGSEFSDHRLIENKTGLDIYFAHPYSAFERGTNENTNGLIRQYIPKRTAFAEVTPYEVQKIEWLLNHRPRKKLNYLTPFEAYYGYCPYPRQTQPPKALAA